MAIEYQADCEKIQDAAKVNGIVLTLDQCQTLWRAYSDRMSAGWLVLPKDDKVLAAILIRESTIEPTKKFIGIAGADIKEGNDLYLGDDGRLYPLLNK